MALIYCYECAERISDKAKACPHCGAPSKLDLSGVVDIVRDRRDPSKLRERTPEEVRDFDRRVLFLCGGIALLAVAIIIGGFVENAF